MQAAEMLCGTRVYHLVFLISLAIGYVHSFPIQILPSIPGYIPVYIRHGDQPLEEINPALAEAFHEGSHSLKATVLPNVNGPTDISLEQEEAHKDKIEAIHVRQAEINDSSDDEKSNDPTKKDTDAEPLKEKPTSEPVVKLLPLTEEEKDVLEKLRVELKEESANSDDKHDSNKVPSNEKDKLDEVADEMPHLHLLTSKDRYSVHEDVPALSDKKPIKQQPFSYMLSNVRKVVVPPEVLHQLEAERAENQSLEEKSK
ncbi:uncharacterized protein LOC143221874 isoform X2 [Lasioglossum baleicum]|uniref:uncharacterized protein LOC143221874 isoform X2 n=1 Tax=Lasioglossum baleicum TaxID=434251 RepID=UPI003FCCD083